MQLKFVKLSSWAVPSYHMTYCKWKTFDVLHMICKWLRPGHWSLHVGESSQLSEIAKILNCAFQCNYIIIFTTPTPPPPQKKNALKGGCKIYNGGPTVSQTTW